ncbi:hypothetical protein SBOR_6443 [Sclerotinia borealis F-4128]|uniref:Calpain catalytic domain-containing protein n=1 Tax=Sclerotinia borealis (strain F-4128) TaxID=1432307 RepID=W9CED8_SCLBF|nr:hypothetical protein SBOR_6443 [Sclerotinia borealis F-4128]
MAVITSISSIQTGLDTFWKNNLGSDEIITKSPNILPKHVYSRIFGEHKPLSKISGCSVNISYDAAVKECEAKVAAIVTECRRNNTKYTDNDFDLDDMDYCLKPLTVTEPDTSNNREHTEPESSRRADITRNIITRTSNVKSTATKVREPACAKRVGDIFEHPRFFLDHEAHVQDIRQGSEGDCWFISSLGCLTVDEAFPGLIHRLCPRNARDEVIGVYGFVFYHDGEWISEVIDDKLYLTNPDYDDCDDDRRSVWDHSHERLDPEASRAEYKKTFQTGSDALFFGSCTDSNETWVPLIEKAFAKVHGDFDSINGGWPGEGVEDITGGVTTEFLSSAILDKDLFWSQGFMRIGKDFIFSAGTRTYNHPDPNELGRQGIEDDHAYSVLRAVEYQGNRLCLVKNPWGEVEWNGPWSDGSKEWTREALDALNHRFGNEGIFWMPYEDFLNHYVQIWRTRLFHWEWFKWNVTQHWTTVNVPWSGDYNETSFHFTIPIRTTTIIVLSQLDTRYFGGLTGQYIYSLSFHLHASGEKTHIVRGYSSGDRSATTEIFLEAGTYEIFLQITGYRDATLPKIEEVVKQNWLDRRDKLIQIGLKHDVAHAKGIMHDDLSKKKDRMSLTTPVTLSTPDILTPPSTPAATPTTPTGKDVISTTEDAWNASCVVGLKVYTYQTIATIGLGKAPVSDGVGLGIGGVEGVEGGKEQGIRKLLSLLDDGFASNLRKVKVKMNKKSLKMKWKFRDRRGVEGVEMGMGIDMRLRN